MTLDRRPRLPCPGSRAPVSRDVPSFVTLWLTAAAIQEPCLRLPARQGETDGGREPRSDTHPGGFAKKYGMPYARAAAMEGELARRLREQGGGV
jgi:hypothetical protein